jgi:hypothetical protein
VLGAHERVDLVGWSERPISARAWSAAAGVSGVAVDHDGASGVWVLTLEIGEAGWTKLRLEPDA